VFLTATQIKSDLPNFPDQVIDTWLLPLARDAGWPPAPFSRWDAILLDRPLSFWRSLVWERRIVPLNWLTLESGSLARLQGLIEAGHGANNIYAQQIRDTRKRFRGFVTYLQQHGQLPLPPVVLQTHGQYIVVDGNHRVAAYISVGSSLSGLSCWVGQRPG
jgi:hypothetical protein